MTSRTLIPHPTGGTTHATVAARVELERGGHLTLEWSLTGNLEALAIPRRAASRRADRLCLRVPPRSARLLHAELASAAARAAPAELLDVAAAALDGRIDQRPFDDKQPAIRECPR